MIRSLIVLVTSLMSQTPERAKLPDTTAGRRVAAYVKAFNSGNDQTMRDFLAENVSAQALERRPIEARLEVYRQMRGNRGTIEVGRVLEARDTAVTLLMRSSQGGWFELGFEFEQAEPHKLVGLRVEDAEPPGDANETSEAKDSPARMSESQVIETIDKHLGGIVAADEFSGVVLVAKNNSPLFQKAYGLASREYNVPNRLDTKFNLGSINKIFTQIAIGQLAAQGGLSLDDKLGKHLPDYPNRDAADKVTVRQLLDMTSGIGDFFGPEFERTPKNRLRTIGDYLALFAAKPLLFEPGAKRQYSNGGYVVLGAIIEKVSGTDYYSYVREHVFKPADMGDTDWYEADLVISNLATGYTKQGPDGAGKNARRSNIYTRPARGSSAGGGYSTAQDLLKFVAALRDGRIRIPDFRQTTPAGGQGAGAGGRFGGLGIAGGAPGINAALEADEERGYTIVVLSNYDPPSAENVAREIRGLINRIRE